MKEKRVAVFDLKEILCEQEGQKGSRVSQWIKLWREHNVDQKPFMTREQVDQINSRRQLKQKP